VSLVLKSSSFFLFYVIVVVIASGYRANTIRDVVKGERIGTLFVKNPELAQTLSPQHIALQVVPSSSSFFLSFSS